MLKQLKTFIVVYQTRHFTHAAQQLFISQPTVSVHISQLEAELNTQLFTRNGCRPCSRRIPNCSAPTFSSPLTCSIPKKFCNKSLSISWILA